MAPSRIPTLCQVKSWYDSGVDDGTMCRTRSALPGPFICLDPIQGPGTSQVSPEDQAEFDLLKGRITDLSAEAYVAHRRQYFGSDEEYRKFAEESDRELDQSQWPRKKKPPKKLRDLIELNKKGESAAQTIFYRWVRKAYMKEKGVLDVPAQIASGPTPELQEALKKVKVTSGRKKLPPSFNPRPIRKPNDPIAIKKGGRSKLYKLGTISEHAMGNAVDIDADQNPQLSTSDWTFIEKLTGTKVDRSLNRWRTDPEGLWTDIGDLSDLFVKTVAEKVQAIEEERAKSPPPAAAKGQSKKKKPVPKAPLDVVLDKHGALKAYAKNGFLQLEWALVEALHDNDFVWGATFGDNVDLHHFELP